jgi:hypothetical protein
VVFRAVMIALGVATIQVDFFSLVLPLVRFFTYPILLTVIVFSFL